MSQFKGVVKLTETQFNTLSTTGTITVGGVTYNYDPNGTLYVIGDSLSVFSSSEGGSTPQNMVTTDTAQTITGAKIFSQDIQVGTSSDKTIITDTGLIRKYSNDIQENIDWGRMLRAVESIPNAEHTGLFYEHNPYLYIGETNSQFTKYHTYIGELVNPESPEEHWEWVDITPSGGGSITPVTVITNQSTDSDIPSAKAVWNLSETKADKARVFNDVDAISWISDSTYSNLGFNYACEISIPNVTENDYAEVVFYAEDALSGNYCPEVVTGNGTVTIYSKVNTGITIATIKIEKVLSYYRYNIQQNINGDSCSLNFTTYGGEVSDNYWVASTDDNNSQIIDIINE